jgi:hypothetical protein
MFFVRYVLMRSNKWYLNVVDVHAFVPVRGVQFKIVPHLWSCLDLLLRALSIFFFFFLLSPRRALL